MSILDNLLKTDIYLLNMSSASYLDTDGYIRQFEPLKIFKLHPNAEDITTEGSTNPTFELSIIGRDEARVEDLYGDVNVFTTGISITTPKNFHAEIIEHPQLYKTGYSLVGAPRVVFPGDGGEILLPLYKFKEAEDLELPFRAAIVVLRPSLYFTLTLGTGRDQDDYEEEDVKPKKKGLVARKGRSQKNNHMF